MKKRLASLNLVLQSVGTLVNILFVSFSVRTLGLESWGIYVVYEIAASFVVTILGWGFNLGTSKYISKQHVKSIRTAAILYSILLFQLFFLFCLFFSLLLASFFVSRLNTNLPAWLDWHILLTLTLFVSGKLFFLDWFYVGIGRPQLSALVQTASKVLSLIVLFISLIYVPLSPSYLLGIQGLSMISMGLVIFLVNGIKFKHPSWAVFLSRIKADFKFFLVLCLGSFSTYFTSLFIGFGSGSTALGLFSIFERTINICKAISSPILSYYYPFSCQAFSSYNKVYDREKILFVIKQASFFLSPPFVLLCLFFTYPSLPIFLFSGQALNPSLFTLSLSLYSLYGMIMYIITVFNVLIVYPSDHGFFSLNNDSIQTVVLLLLFSLTFAFRDSLGSLPFGFIEMILFASLLMCSLVVLYRIIRYVLGVIIVVPRAI